MRALSRHEAKTRTRLSAKVLVPAHSARDIDPSRSRAARRPDDGEPIRLRPIQHRPVSILVAAVDALRQHGAGVVAPIARRAGKRSTRSVLKSGARAKTIVAPSDEEGRVEFVGGRVDRAGQTPRGARILSGACARCTDRGGRRRRAGRSRTGAGRRRARASARTRCRRCYRRAEVLGRAKARGVDRDPIEIVAAQTAGPIRAEVDISGRRTKKPDRNPARGELKGTGVADGPALAGRGATSRCRSRRRRQGDRD